VVTVRLARFPLGISHGFSWEKRPIVAQPAAAAAAVWPLAMHSVLLVAAATVVAAAAVAVASAAGCSSDAGCSYNGACQQGTCHCDAAWDGPSCGSLRLLPTSRTSGLRAEDDGRNTSTWGGTVALDNVTGKLHMWASQMAGHCGIQAWKINSFIVHAVAAADSPGAFTRVDTKSSGNTDMTFPIFTHEPSVSRAPTGEWVLYWSGYPKDHGLGPPCLHACTDGWTPSNLSAYGCKLPRGGSPPTYMSWAASPDGPWSPPVQVLAAPWDTNLAVVILANGSAVGTARRSGMPVYLVTAGNWKNASSYVYHAEKPLLQLPGRRQVIEDGSVYLDSAGRFHAIFHSALNGIHAFSADGLSWTYGGVAWNNTVEFEDGGHYAFHRRERPHFVFGDASAPHRITALTTAVSYGDQGDSDACFTLLQPVH
jgi:hypothetical protein